MFGLQSFREPVNKSSWNSAFLSLKISPKDFIKELDMAMMTRS